MFHESTTTSHEVHQNLNAIKTKTKNKVQNKIKKDLQINKLLDIEELDENFEFILKDDVT
jgi:hypothetical protein